MSGALLSGRGTRTPILVWHASSLRALRRSCHLHSTTNIMTNTLLGNAETPKSIETATADEQEWARRVFLDVLPRLQDLHQSGETVAQLEIPANDVVAQEANLEPTLLGGSLFLRRVLEAGGLHTTLVHRTNTEPNDEWSLEIRW